MRHQAKAHGVHFLNCDEAMISGVRFLGYTLWTDFCESTVLAMGPLSKDKAVFVGAG